METELLSEYISPDPQAKNMVLFGGNRWKRHEVILQLQKIGGVNIYGTLSEEEGYQKMQSLSHVDLVLIGGRYPESQRIHIRKYIKENFPITKITEPGIDYPYESQIILERVNSLFQ